MKRTVTVGALCAAGALAAPLANAQAAPLVDRPLKATTVMPDPLRSAAVGLSVNRHISVARAHAREQGERLSREERWKLRERLSEKSPEAIRARTRALRDDLHDLRERTTSVAVPAQLQAIASCESGGDPGAVDPSGTYRGKYQFDQGTWNSVGGTGDPAAAPEAVQDRLAAKLYDQAGPGRWPVCGA